MRITNIERFSAEAEYALDSGGWSVTKIFWEPAERKVLDQFDAFCSLAEPLTILNFTVQRHTWPGFYDSHPPQITGTLIYQLERLGAP